MFRKCSATHIAQHWWNWLVKLGHMDSIVTEKSAVEADIVSHVAERPHLTPPPVLQYHNSDDEAMSQITQNSPELQTRFYTSSYTTMALNGTMRAVVWEGVPFEMPIRSIPIPSLLAETDALVRVTASAICGSDLHIYRGLYGSPDVPWTVGHEGMGYVLEIDEAVAHV
ncbi:hypothetical protein QQX98_000380 [Neonectria punicea]|uniref:Alcohol dehydrogenase-like N-terminal domain-containing protein n=1 Tax=Neonectria punicea TaxID=979145 RepID=A0ABR1HU53_9HYPO